MKKEYIVPETRAFALQPVRHLLAGSQVTLYREEETSASDVQYSRLVGGHGEWLDEE